MSLNSDRYPNIKSTGEWDLFTLSNNPIIISGPCSAESETQLLDTAKALSDLGIKFFRAGVWKPRTYPGSFEGVGDVGLEWLSTVKRETGMRVMTEVANAIHLEKALKAGMDMIWIGARTSGNPFALQEIADAIKGVDIPVFVKNPLIADLNQWIGAIERIYNAGITSMGAIHRGFAQYQGDKYRFSPYWQIAVEIRRIFPDMPFFCDPSHIAGEREYLQELSQKAIDLGFDGLFIESHIDPDNALSDSRQQITPSQLGKLLERIKIKKYVPAGTLHSEMLEQFRSRIDTLDDSLVRILAERLDIASKIGELKKENNITVLQTQRWEKLLKNVVATGESAGLDSEFIKQIFELIHQESIKRQI